MKEKLEHAYNRDKLKTLEEENTSLKEKIKELTRSQNQINKKNHRNTNDSNCRSDDEKFNPKLKFPETVYIRIKNHIFIDFFYKSSRFSSNNQYKLVDDYKEKISSLLEKNNSGYGISICNKNKNKDKNTKKYIQVDKISESIIIEKKKEEIYYCLLNMFKNLNKEEKNLKKYLMGGVAIPFALKIKNKV